MSSELEFPGWLHNAQVLLIDVLGEHFEGTEAVFHAAIVVGLVIYGTYFTTRNLQKVPTGLQNLGELIVESLRRFCTTIIGPQGLDFLPLVGTLFLYIFSLNLLGLLPGFKSPTSNVNITFSLACVTFFCTHYYGWKYQGVGYLKHFLGEPLWLAPLMLPIHLIGELARPVSLTFRLFGNIMGEDTAIAVFIGLGIGTGLYLPLQLPLMALAVFTSLVQAVVFTLLSSIYISGATTVHEHHEAHGEAQGHAAPGAPARAAAGHSPAHA
ncbi:MAG: F0F1 ATP synthase subunit A [Planctomycetes bacterium]|nr:F0F1 ATP synthase subunit A [Planctomycetota bacterium]